MPLASRPAPGIELFRLVVIEKDVGQHHRSDLQAARANPVERALLGERLHHERAKAADRAFLDRDQDFVVRGEPANEIVIERLGETRVGDRRRDAVGREILGGFQSLGQACAEGQDRDLVAFAQDPAAADLEDFPTAGMSMPTPSPRG